MKQRLSLDSPEKYIFTKQPPDEAVTGFGADIDARAVPMRAEDAAFLREAVMERRWFLWFGFEIPADGISHAMKWLEWANSIWLQLESVIESSRLVADSVQTVAQSRKTDLVIEGTIPSNEEFEKRLFVDGVLPGKKGFEEQPSDFPHMPVETIVNLYKNLERGTRVTLCFDNNISGRRYEATEELGGVEWNYTEEKGWEPFDPHAVYTVHPYVSEFQYFASCNKSIAWNKHVSSTKYNLHTNVIRPVDDHFTIDCTHEFELRGDESMSPTQSVFAFVKFRYLIEIGGEVKETIADINETYMVRLICRQQDGTFVISVPYSDLINQMRVDHPIPDPGDIEGFIPYPSDKTIFNYVEASMKVEVVKIAGLWKMTWNARVLKDDE